MITSADNPKIKQARMLLTKRGREQQGRCLVEGVRLIEDAMRAGVHPALILFSSSVRGSERGAALLEAAEAAGVQLWEVADPLFQTLSDTVTSQGVVAIVEIPTIPVSSDTSLVLILDQVRDPGNLGTILRSAEAAGASLVLLTRGCADPWSPKVLRAGMGVHFRLPVREPSDWAEIAEFIRGWPLWLADARGAVAYDEVDWTAHAALVVGGETTGISPEAVALAQGRVAIPMQGGVESLNAAMAATVLLFEIARQRRAAVRGQRR